jgi:hypothetical protein
MMMAFPTVTQLVALLNFNHWNLYGSYLVVTPPNHDDQMIFSTDRGLAVIRIVNGPDAGPIPGQPAPHGGANYTLYHLNFTHLTPPLLVAGNQQVVIVPVVDLGSLAVETNGENALQPPQVVNVSGQLL